MSDGKVFTYIVRGIFEDLIQNPSARPGHVEALAASLCATIEAEKRAMLEKLKTVKP